MITVQQASVNALAAWITSQLSPAGVVVDTQWATPGKDRPRKAVTIILAGPRIDFPWDPRILSATNKGTNKSTVRWQLKACEQPIQLDVWANTDVERDDILARLDIALNVGDPTGYDPDPVSNGVLVQLAGDWSDTFADCDFLSTDITDDSDSVTRSEYRATIRGRITCMLSVTKDSARQIQINLKQRLNGRSTDPYDITTLTTGGGQTGSSGP